MFNVDAFRSSCMFCLHTFVHALCMREHKVRRTWLRADARVFSSVPKRTEHRRERTDQRCSVKDHQDIRRAFQYTASELVLRVLLLQIMTWHMLDLFFGSQGHSASRCLRSSIPLPVISTGDS